MVLHRLASSYGCSSSSSCTLSSVFDLHPNSFAFKLRDTHSDPNDILEAYQLYAHSFGMPIFFVIGGISAVLSYSKSNNVYKTILMRASRLLIPLIVGLVLLVVPAKFPLRMDNVCNDITPPSNLFSFYLYYFHHCFTSQGVWWLWFLVLLFAVNSIVMPLVDVSCKLFDNPSDSSCHTKCFIMFIVYSLISFIPVFFGLPLLSSVGFTVQLFVVTLLLSLQCQAINKGKDLFGCFAWIGIGLSVAARVLIHLSIPKENKTIAVWVYILYGFTSTQLLGSGLVFFKNDFLKFIENKKALGIFSVIVFVFSLFTMGIIGGQSEPRWDYLKLNGIYVTYDGGIGNTSRMTFHLTTLILMAVVLPFAILTLNQEIYDWFYLFVKRSVICVYMVHGLILTYLALLVRPLSYGLQLTTLVVATPVLSYSISILIDNIKYLRIAFGYTGKPVPDLFRKKSLLLKRKLKLTIILKFSNKIFNVLKPYFFK
ncbi:hypothetical protein GEMRC1_011180 [Eukaryota sp. GEM-RC1]